MEEEVPFSIVEENLKCENLFSSERRVFFLPRNTLNVKNILCRYSDKFTKFVVNLNCKLGKTIMFVVTKTSQSPDENEKLIAAVDLGSNSFHLMVARVVLKKNDSRLKKIDSVKEHIKLADGLNAYKELTEPYLLKAIRCLTRFSERLRSFSPERVRVVGTNTFRVAKNIGEFLPKFEQALGFPINVISGVEEARLIYKGVCNSLDSNGKQKLVIDIGGGSTEFIVGSGPDPNLLESVYIGTSKIKLDFFSTQQIKIENFNNAVLWARKEIQVITRNFRKVGWDIAYGCSGTIKSVNDVCRANGLGGSKLSLESLDEIILLTCKVGNLQEYAIPGLKGDRASTFPAGVAILKAIFHELKIENLEFSTAALRTGVLFEIAGRGWQPDQRDRTVKHLIEQYEVDRLHASRVSNLATNFLKQLVDLSTSDNKELKKIIHWTSLLLEIGQTLSHNAYHRHSSYIVANSDMPGFTLREQTVMASLILGHTGKLPKVSHILNHEKFRASLICLRLAAIFSRSRVNLNPPEMFFRYEDKNQVYILEMSKDWIDLHPLTAFTLKQEVREWRKVGIKFSLSYYFTESKSINSEIGLL